jgi:hypothetical protein
VRDALLLSAALISSVAGLAWLALAMDVHWRQVFGARSRQAGTVVGLRILGAVGLALSLWLCLRVDHASMASLVWIMSVAAAALLVAFTLAWRPRWLSAFFPPASVSLSAH